MLLFGLFKQLLILALVSQAAFALFRFLGAAGRNLIFANTIGTLIWLALFALGGCVLSPNDDQEVVGMGLLVLTLDVCTECYNCKRVPWDELEQSNECDRR
ncbi:hypothetical protein Dimus_027803 [Dionaea muscipula]